MKAALLQSDATFKVEEVPTPEPGQGEILIEVAYCGICGSDLHFVDMGLMPPGIIMGHESSGRVAAVGEGVEGWSEGDRVVILPLNPCLECEPCRRGDIQLCLEGVIRGYGLGANPGGFAQYMTVKPSMLFPMPEGLDLKTAALNEPWSVAVRGVNMSGCGLGVHAVVMGAGPIGLLCLYALKLSGAGLICVSEPDPFRAERAAAAGADVVVDPKKANPGDKVRETAGRGPDFVFDCAGIESSLEEAVSISDPHGHIVALGVPMGNASIFPLNWFTKEITLNFSLGYTLREFRDSIGLLARGAVDTEVVVSDVVPLSEIDQAFKDLHGSGHAKILVDCQAA